MYTHDVFRFRRCLDQITRPGDPATSPSGQVQARDLRKEGSRLGAGMPLVTEVGLRIPAGRSKKVGSPKLSLESDDMAASLMSVQVYCCCVP